MAATDPTAPVVENPFSPEHRANPYPIFNQVRELAPIHRAADGSWVVTRWADANAMLRDPRFGSDPALLRGAAAEQLRDSPIRQVGTSVMMFIDPPDHTRLRGLVSKAFSPRVVEELRPRVQDLVDGLLDAVSPSGELDVVADLAYPLPVAVICELLGVPEVDHDTFRRLSSDASRLLDGPALAADIANEGIAAGMQLFQYFTDLVEQRRSAPGDDLLSRMIEAEEEGDKLSHAELITTATLLFVAGHETTSNLIGNAVLALLDHPGELDRLRREPALVRTAVEEAFRWDPAVQFIARIASTDVEIGGHQVAAGEQVIAIVGAVNRDPHQFADPDRFDVARQDNRHLTLSAGPHFCLGAALARVEAQTAVGTLVERFGDTLQLRTTELRYREHQVLRGLDELVVGFAPPAAPAAR